jgi:hypothetical protein
VAPEPEGSLPLSHEPATGPYPELLLTYPQRSVVIPSSHLRLNLPNGVFLSDLVYFSVPSLACYMPRPPHSSWLHLPNDIWGWVQIKEVLIVLFLHSPVTSCLFCPNIPLRTLFSNTLVYALPLMWETKFHTNTKQLAELWFCIF